LVSESKLWVLSSRFLGLGFVVWCFGSTVWGLGSGSGCGVWLLQLQAWGFAKLTFGVRFRAGAQVECVELGLRRWAGELVALRCVRGFAVVIVIIVLAIVLCLCVSIKIS